METIKKGELLSLCAELDTHSHEDIRCEIEYFIVFKRSIFEISSCQHTKRTLKNKLFDFNMNVELISKIISQSEDYLVIHMKDA